MGSRANPVRLQGDAIPEPAPAHSGASDESSSWSVRFLDSYGRIGHAEVHLLGRAPAWEAVLPPHEGWIHLPSGDRLIALRIIL